MQLEMIGALAMLAVLIVAAQGWGLLALPIFRLDLEPGERFWLAQALGWGVMYLPLLALGLLGLLVPLALWLIVLLGLAASVPQWKGLASWWRSRSDVRPRDISVWLPLVVSAVLFVVTLPGALGPPSETDSLRAELAQARVWLGQHGAVFVANYHWNQPPLAEFLFTLGLGIGPDSLPSLLHWWMGGLTALTLFTLGRRLVGNRAAALGTLIYSATPTLAYSAASSKQELFLGLYGWLALYALLRWRAGAMNNAPAEGCAPLGWTALCGLLAGFGAATKLMGLYTLPILGVLLLWFAAKHKPRREMVWGALAFGAAALAVNLPWWLRNFVIAGDPFWPTGAGLFAARYTTPDMLAFLARVKDGFGVGRTLGTYLLGLWHVTQDYPLFSDPRTPTPPTFLIFLPALVAGWRERPPKVREALGAMWVFCLGVYTFWWLQPQVPRYLYPLWGVASLAAGAAAAKLLEWDWPARLGATAALGFTAALSLAISLLFARQFWPLLAGTQTREAYLTEHVSYYQDFRQTGALTPTGSRIWVLEALSLYYLDDDYLMGLPPWEGLIDYDRYQTGADLLPALQNLGVTHVLWIEKPGHVTDLMIELADGGYLEEVYRNPEGRRVNSRTLGAAEPSLVVLWRVRYP